ncbi:MAG: hypothetical protein ACOY33_02120 [Pseudomonadota bacterium]
MPATRGDVTLRNVDGAAVHTQVEQLKSMLREMMPDDSIEANNLRNAIKLLSDIERQLDRKSATHH